MRSSMIHRKRQTGFTLIELMVTVVVFSVLALVAVPTFTDYLARSRLRSAAEAVVNQLGVARADAMRQHRNVLVSFGTSGTRWCSGGRQFELPSGGVEGITLTAGNATACNCTTSAGQATCLVAGSPSLVVSEEHATVELLAGGTSAFQFDRNVGVIDNLTGGTITLRSLTRPTRYQLNVIVSPLGHARVCVPAGFAIYGGYRSC